MSKVQLFRWHSVDNHWMFNSHHELGTSEKVQETVDRLSRDLESPMRAVFIPDYGDSGNMCYWDSREKFAIRYKDGSLSSQKFTQHELELYLEDGNVPLAPFSVERV